MDVLSLLRLLARHWRVTAPAALLTLVGLVGVVKVSAPTYNATGSIVLLNPREAPDLENNPAAPAPSEIGQNPFTRYGDIAIVTDILTRKMNSDSKRDELAQHGVAGYGIVTSEFARDPVFEITGKGPDAASAMRSTEVVLDDAGTVLSELQVEQGADPEYLISSAPLEAPSTATAMYSSTMRAAIAVLAVGGLGTLGLAVLAEIVGQRRAASGRGRGDSDAEDEVVEAAGSNGSAVRGRGDSDAEDEVVETRGSNDSAASTGTPVVPGSARSQAAGRGLGVSGSSGSFDSTGIVPDGSPRAAGREGRNGSPAWGRAVAPLGRRPHRRPSLPDASDGPSSDDHGDRSTPDR